MARGSRRQRGKSWELRVHAHGRYWTRTLPPVAGKALGARAADDALRKFIGEIQRTTPERGSVAQLAADWLAAAATRQLSPSTLAGYGSRVRTIILPEWGDRPVQDITTHDVDRLYAKVGQRLSPRSVRSLHVVVHGMFTQAVRWRWLTENPARHAGVPKKVRTPIHPPDAAQVRHLIDAAADDKQLEMYLFLAAVTGARRGELVALQWDDVDWQGGRLVIRRNLSQPARGAPVAKAPKTDDPRVLRLDPVVLAALVSYRDETRVDGLGRGPWLFSVDADHRQPWRPDGATSRFRRLAKRAGVDGVRLHDLRHYVATHLIARGDDPVTVAQQLGHKTPSVTLDVYSQFMPARGDDAAAYLASLMLPPADTTRHDS